MGPFVLVMFGALSLTAVGFADTYWIAWEGQDWPDNMNPPWIRNWGNWQGPG